MFGINKKNKKPTLAAKSKSPEEPKEISLDKPGKTAANKQTSKQTIVPDLICKVFFFSNFIEFKFKSRYLTKLKTELRGGLSCARLRA